MTNEHKTEAAQRIVSRIIRDVEGRKGLGNEWEMIDPEIRREIRQKWESIVVEALDA